MNPVCPRCKGKKTVHRPILLGSVLTTVEEPCQICLGCGFVSQELKAALSKLATEVVG